LKEVTMTTLKAAKGNKVTIEFGGRKKATFTAGGRKRYLVHKEYDSGSMGPIGSVMVNGVLRLADGTEAFCLLEIDESSSGEHCGTGVFLPDGGFVWQDEDGFAAAMGKTSDQIFPYHYKYTGTVKALSDHHVGDDGWSF
jgi:hypothetical protein